MVKIPGEMKHGKQSVLLIVSRMLERAAYYGSRSILVIYMVRGTLAFSDQDASSVYGWFISSFLFSQILGAVLGDLLTGHKRAMIIGGLLQTSGLFMLAIPSPYGLYSGLVFTSLGMGLYSPNLLAQFGKNYQDKRLLLSGGFTLLYAFISIASMLGILFISSLSNQNYALGFIISGLLTLGSTGIIFFTIKPTEVYAPQKIQPGSIPSILYAVLLVSIFWAMNEVGEVGMATKLEPVIQAKYHLGFSIASLWGSPSFIIGIIAAIILSYTYYDLVRRWILGFLLGGLCCLVLFYVWYSATSVDLPLMILALLMMDVAEILIVPMALAVITRYGNPKYLAILTVTLTIPIVSTVLPYLWYFIDNHSDTIFIIPAVVLVVIAILLFVFRKKAFPEFIYTENENSNTRI